MITAYSLMRGHLIGYDSEKKEWVYADDKSPISVERPCIRCGRMPTPEGYDACLGYIPGATSVCCGHGVDEPIMVMKGEKVVSV